MTLRLESAQEREDLTVLLHGLNELVGKPDRARHVLQDGNHHERVVILALEARRLIDSLYALDLDVVPVFLEPPFQPLRHDTFDLDDRDLAALLRKEHRVLARATAIFDDLIALLECLHEVEHLRLARPDPLVQVDPGQKERLRVV